MSSGKLVTLGDFIRAETDTYFRRYAVAFDCFGMGTRYVAVIFRTLVNEADPSDIPRVNNLQDQIAFEQQSPGMLELPDWDQGSLQTIRDLLLPLVSH